MSHRGGRIRDRTIKTTVVASRSAAAVLSGTLLVAGRRPTLLTDAEVAEDDVQQLVDAHRAGDASERAQRQPEVFGRQRNLRRRERPGERLLTFAERLAMARAGEWRRRRAVLH